MMTDLCACCNRIVPRGQYLCVLCDDEAVVLELNKHNNMKNEHVNRHLKNVAMYDQLVFNY